MYVTHQSISIPALDIYTETADKRYTKKTRTKINVEAKKKKNNNNKSTNMI